MRALDSQSINPEDREKFERANGRGKSHDCCVHLDTRHFDPNQSIQILKILNSFLEYISVIYVIDLFEPING